MKHIPTWAPLPVVLIAWFIMGCSKQADNHDWPVYLGDKSSSHFSSLNQITLANVDRLEVAWTFDAGGARENERSLMECNPLVIDGVIYVTSAKRNLYALDGATGEKLWMMNPFEELNQTIEIPITPEGANRGLAYWSDGTDSRLLYGVDYYLVAIDPRNGRLIQSFGDQGKINLKKGLGRDIDKLSYNVKSPGIVFEDFIIMGSSVSESIPAAPGHIRAFNVRTGEQVWRFNTIPQPGEYGYETWPEEAHKYFGGANVWTGMSLDEERGLVYCPTGSATFDFYGGDRIGQNLFANTLLCLDARTGKRIWHYQIVHHDLHDYDLPAPPNLLTIKRDGKEIPAVAQLTKQGFIFVFNRITGDPIFPIEERPVPQSEIPGEQSWPTQPRPTKPAPYTRETFSIDQVTDISPASHQEIMAKYTSIRPHAPFQAPNEKMDTIVHPGMIGGVEWGGGATDQQGILYFNANEVPAMLTMIDINKVGSEGERVYLQNCVACHGPEFEGGTAFGQVVPTLLNITERKELNEIVATIMNGGTSMPAFRHLSGKEVFDLIHYLEDPEKITSVENEATPTDPPKSRFIHTGNRMWYDSKGYPAIKPPWGTLNAIDLNTGDYRWRVPFGEYPELLDQGISQTGRPSFGGPITTGSGLLFIGASLDNHMRAFDMKSGKELWRRPLPAGGYATPATYLADGKQYVLIACGGGRDSPVADMFVAFALPD